VEVVKKVIRDVIGAYHCNISFFINFNIFIINLASGLFYFYVGVQYLFVFFNWRLLGEPWTVAELALTARVPDH
jgi:hypothetical protein